MKSELDGQGEARKSYRAILTEQIAAAEHEFRRPWSGLFVSSISAGLDLGFSVFFMGVIQTLLEGRTNEALARLLIAGAYAIGFIFVILGRTELFTEHTTIAVLPVLDRRESLVGLIKLWGVIYAGNLLGGVLFSAMAVYIGPAMNIIDPRAFTELAEKMVGHESLTILASAILAGWMMGLLSWLTTASRDTVSQIIFVALITGGIGLAGLHHSIVGSIEVLSGVFAGETVGLGDYLYFLWWTTLGNAVGGIVFVALLKYGHTILDERRSHH